MKSCKILNTKKIETAIERSPFTKAQIAEKSEMSRVTLDNVIKGKEVGLQKFLKLCDALNEDVGYFFDEEKVMEEYNANGERAIAGKKIRISKIDNRTFGIGDKISPDSDIDQSIETSIILPETCSDEIKFAVNLLKIENQFLRNQLADCRERIMEYKERIAELKNKIS